MPRVHRTKASNDLRGPFQASIAAKTKNERPTKQNSNRTGDARNPLRWRRSGAEGGQIQGERRRKEATKRGGVPTRTRVRLSPTFAVISASSHSTAACGTARNKQKKAVNARRLRKQQPSTEQASREQSKKRRRNKRGRKVRLADGDPNRGNNQNRKRAAVTGGAPDAAPVGSDHCCERTSAEETQSARAEKLQVRRANGQRTEKRTQERKTAIPQAKPQSITRFADVRVPWRCSRGPRRAGRA